MKKNFVLGFLMLVSGMVSAQQKKANCPWSFHSINNVGLLDGSKGSAFQLQTVNGVQYKSWYTGVGLGLDYYRYRTIPLFLDIRKEFFSGADKLFVYADGGISFAWVTDSQKNEYVDDHFSNGFYNDFGLGYKRKVGKKSAMLISAGYSFKKLTEFYSPLYFTPAIYGNSFAQTNYPEQKINYSMNRLSLKIGWEF